jgi:plastocyanin
VTQLLAEIGSDRVLVAVIVGIPVALAAVFLLLSVPKSIGPAHVFGTLVVIGAVVVGMWAAFASEPPSQTNSLPIPAGGTQFPNFTPSAPPPSGSPSPAPSPSASATCAPSGTTNLTVTAPVGASVNGFVPTCLAVKSGTDFSVTFKNDDTGVTHTWALFTNSSATDRIGGAPSASAFITGPAETTYQIKALQPGTYFFRCDIHPTVMTGTFVVAS